MINQNRKGFTLIELLTVIAIIGILAAILIPTVGAAKIAAKKAQTKVQFSQWATSMGLFKQEYGYYPDFGTGANNSTPGTLQNNAKGFFAALSAQTYTGGTFTAMTTPDTTYGNTKLLSFYSPSNNDVVTTPATNPNIGQMQDAFGNVDIKMCIDTSGNNTINAPTTKPASITYPSNSLTPASTTTTIQAGVIFYSAGAGRSSTDIVYSWQ